MKIVEMETAVSTNDEIKKYSDEDYTAVLAYRQTAGRGSKEREFVSPYGGAYFSVVFHPDKGLVEKGLITPLIAVAVREALEKFYSVSCGIKRINDLYYRDKKVCGILTEGKTVGEETAVYAGIGVNFYKSPEGYGAYSDIAGYIFDKPVDRAELKLFVERVVTYIKAFAEGDSDIFMEKYVKYEYIPPKKS